jgi:ubiquinone/menaquinone biosynthesis C-methylase UbiE
LSSTPESRQLDLIRERFTETAGSFGDYVLAGRGDEAEKLAALATAGEDVADWRAVDLACGPGTFARTLASRVRFVVGLDLTPALLLRAQKSVGKAAAAARTQCAFVCGDGNRIPFADGSFDLAVCGFSIHHMLHAERVIRELTRIVRPGGRVAILDMIARDGYDRDLQTRIEQTRDASHTVALFAGEFESLLRKSGMDVLGKDVEEKTRNFDVWMNAMKVPPGTAAYAETRRLLEGTLKNDAAGMRPRFNKQGELEYALPSLYIVAQKREPGAK